MGAAKSAALVHPPAEDSSIILVLRTDLDTKVQIFYTKTACSMITCLIIKFSRVRMPHASRLLTGL